MDACLQRGADRTAGRRDPAHRRRAGLTATFLALLAAASPAAAMPGSTCARLLLWGDGRHDDTAALNAWFRSEPVLWAETGKRVGPKIARHDFRLSGPIYIPSGTGRRLEDFQMVWPRRGERLTGGMILAGDDPNRPPVTSGITKIGGDSGEGVPFAGPNAKPPAKPASAASCLIS